MGVFPNVWSIHFVMVRVVTKYRYSSEAMYCCSVFGFRVSWLCFKLGIRLSSYPMETYKEMCNSRLFKINGASVIR